MKIVLRVENLKEINFCPFCDAPRHKIANIRDNEIFCKECNTFFRVEIQEYQCPKCESNRIADADFPSPDGEIVFHCQKCKKMYPAKDFFRKQAWLKGDDD